MLLTYGGRRRARDQDHDSRDQDRDARDQDRDARGQDRDARDQDRDAQGRNRGAGAIAGTQAFRWITALVTVSAVVLLPWAAYLAASLPSSVSARHWSAAWTGLDVLMACGLAVTGWLALRRDRRIAFSAGSSAAVLVVDAWFDVCTSPSGRPLVFALVDMLIELSEAAACLVLAWIVWHDKASQ